MIGVGTTALELARALPHRSRAACRWLVNAAGLEGDRIDPLTGVELADAWADATRLIPCDLVVFTGDWIPPGTSWRAWPKPLMIRPG